MDISKDTNGTYFLNWTDGHQSTDHIITDPEDPRSQMNYVIQLDHNGNNRYLYGIMLARRRVRSSYADGSEDDGEPRSRLVHRQYLEMKNTWVKAEITTMEDYKNKTIIMKRNKTGDWNIKVKRMITIEI